MDLMQNFHLLRPGWLLALPLLWGTSFWLARRNSGDGDWKQLVDSDLLPGLLLASDSKRNWTPWPWLALAWTIAVLALSGPSWQKETSVAFRGTEEWALILDLSPSMAASDVKPNRFTRARYALDDILNSAKDARVSLIAFSDEPYTVTPMTDDVATIRALLPPLSPNIMPSAGDNVAPALEQAEKLIRQGGANKGQIIVLTDGFSDPAAAFVAAKKLKSQGMTVNVVAIGTPAGAPLSKQDGSFVQNAQGTLKMASLDVELLQQLASAGGGRYVELSQLPDLLTNLQARSEQTGKVNAEKNIQVQHWLDGGVWLLPFLLLASAFLARRGWL
ncbi:vWA domain-containing protein [Sulfurirhabdus autotrophica]|uniref:von Willebrand factor type A domain-containing protein n=1 Tax=Sulfurirhabdus autotrophica TaxID=1706046 RepID=A0A4R3YEB7_9PROT|nr:VWA domain-containing protein [Sulfurirhabdus autotrophica]TCV89498.1 von Willebrand factor type A domain-containing protein [Sulfurirhabdus autotrophica]